MDEAALASAAGQTANAVTALVIVVVVVVRRNRIGCTGRRRV